MTPDGTSRAPGGTARPALARCAGVEPAVFAGSYWGKAPLLTRAADSEGRGAGFTDLLGLDDVDELLSRRGLRTPFLRVAKDGQVVPAARFTGGGGAGAEVSDQVLDERVLALYAGGATLVLQGLHRLWPPLVDFATELAGQVGQPAQVNAYLTPAGGRGFATHYDTHDVFVLQVDGRKRWRVHEPVLPDPLERQAWGGRAAEVAATAVGDPALDVVLGPGDALYLPRGWLHAADALAEPSLHLTVGIRALTRYAVVEALLDLATADPRLRATLPFGLDVADPDQLGPALADTVEALRDWLSRADPAAVAGRLRERAWRAGRPAPIRPVAQAAAIEILTADTRLAVRPGLRWRLVPDGADRVALHTFDRTVSFPGWCALPVRVLLDGGVERVGDLPGMDPDDQLVLARRLLREAIVVPLDRSREQHQ
ncbi:MAG TPA: cupin domain-containing protein [Pilimelia sp.]|nr:cupin domain-containing protein [Pilimelia sp.]